MYLKVSRHYHQNVHTTKIWNAFFLRNGYFSSYAACRICVSSANNNYNITLPNSLSGKNFQFPSIACLIDISLIENGESGFFAWPINACFNSSS